MAELQARSRVRSIASFEDGDIPSPVFSLNGGSGHDDPSLVLSAIAELSVKLDRVLAAPPPARHETAHLEQEIAKLREQIEFCKMEMAAIRHPLVEESRFAQAEDDLGAVVQATERSTNVIMASAEELEAIVQELRAQLPPGYSTGRLADMSELIIRIYEACNFQDLTGQRIQRVLRTMDYIEERVESMMQLWNENDFAAMPLPKDITPKDGDLDMHGPQAEDAQGFVSQAEIDALFD